ncbi:MAG: DNA polymerase III subunit alpha [Desulfosalsimonadaceae bacterium]
MVPLTVRSGYSLMWGASGVDALCRHARNLGYERLALTDTDNLCGLWPFLAACRREGLRPVVGAEVTDPANPARAVCLVKDRQGYCSLCRLLTQRKTSADFNLIAALVDSSKGLTVLASNTELLRTGRECGMDIAAAMPRRPVPYEHPLRRTARRLDIPQVATPGSFFTNPEEFAVHRVLRAIAQSTSLSRLQTGDTAPADAFLAAPETYRQRFAACPEAIANTAAIAERLAFTGPDFGLVMPPYEADTPEQANRHLREAAYEGALWRYGEVSSAAAGRLEHELGIISDMGFSGYFLIVADIVRQSPRTCGRGSGAASLVAYCLGITNVCPLKHNLYFERFLNPGRRDPPDIDVDFAWDERDAVISNVLSRYRERAALVACHVCFQPRMAVRETARVFGLTEKEIKRVGKHLPGAWPEGDPDGSLQERLAGMARMRGVDLSGPWPDILSIARRITGLPRNLSVHPGGVVVTPGPIASYAPVQTASKGVPILQWDKDGVEAAGLVKIDLLGNRSLGVVRDALAEIRTNGVAFAEQYWAPEDDPDTRAALSRGETMGCFYIESPAMRLLQQKARAGDFEHLVIHSSIIRPAGNEVIQQYLQRLRGASWEPLHPLMEGVLEETYGLMVFQEDVSRAAVRIAGFSHAEADGLRKVMARKDRARHLEDYAARFAAGARQRGVSEGDRKRIWRMIMSFSGYSFCKPHSASYARVSFQAVYLKTHYPAEFMAAVISNQGGFYSTFAYVSEARRMGLEIVPPDAATSRLSWSGREKSLQVGFCSVKGLSRDGQERIIAERRKCAFRDAIDFFDRVRPDEAEARALIHCGALDRFSPEKNRAELLWQFCAWRKGKCPRDIGLPLFYETVPAAVPDLPADAPGQRLRREFSVLGFLCGAHPMTLFADQLQKSNAIKACRLKHYVNRRVQFAGWLITGKTVVTKKGDPMQFVTFEDETGLVEAAFLPKAYHSLCHILDCGRPFLLCGRVGEDRGAVTLAVDGVRPL